MKSANCNSVRNWIDDLVPQVVLMLDKIGVKDALVERLSIFADYMDKFKKTAKPKTIQPQPSNYSLCVVGAGELLGLDVLMTNQKSSLFSYEILSEKFSYYVVPPLAIQLIFDKRVQLSAINLFINMINYRISSMATKINATALDREEDRITYRDGELVYAGGQIDLAGIPSVREVELQMLYDNIMNPINKENAEKILRKSKVVDMMKLEEKLKPGNLASTKKSSHILRNSFNEGA